jgi:ribosome-associated heat shock protein Hsp15
MGGHERIVIVTRVIAKRVGAAIAVQCLIDKSPPAPPPELIASLPRRDRGAGRPTKRERRETDRLRGRSEG